MIITKTKVNFAFPSWLLLSFYTQTSSNVTLSELLANETFLQCIQGCAYVSVCVYVAVIIDLYLQQKRERKAE